MPETPKERPTPTDDLVGSLNAVLADALDLYAQVKTAHWNVRGPRFPSLHPLFDTFAKELRHHIDEIAERAVTIGGVARGDVRDAAASSSLDRFPPDLCSDLEVVRTLVERYHVLGGHVKSVRDACETVDADTFDVLTDAARDVDKHAWMLRATLGEAAEPARAAEQPQNAGAREAA